VRLFVAAYPPEPACAHLAAAVDALAVGRAAAAGVNARLAPRANWHVTLAFLGDVPDERRRTRARR
jgi:2'-5' RNA ligase